MAKLAANSPSGSSTRRSTTMTEPVQKSNALYAD